MELTYPIDPLRRRFRGALLRRGEEGYDEGRRVWNGAIDRYPALLARCAGADDVTAAVSFARERDRSVSVTGGGHAVAGHAILRRRDRDRSVTDEPRRGRPRGADGPGAGGALRSDRSDLDRATQTYGLATTGGIVSHRDRQTHLGGGLGHLMRRYRLTVDNLLCVDLVTADWTVMPPRRRRPIGPELPPGSVLSGSRTAARCWPRASQTHLDQARTTVLTVVADCASSRSELVLDAVLPAPG